MLSNKINNLKLIHIAVLVDEGFNPSDFEFVKMTPHEYTFKYLPTKRLINIRR